LNPNCSLSSDRCLDSQNIRTHPSDCSRHYFSADVVTSTDWRNIADYPSDPLGSSVKKKIDMELKKEGSGNSVPYFKRIVANFK